MSYTSKDLVWTKNVTRQKGAYWAYMEYEIGEEFSLNWAKGRANLGRTDIEKSQVNQLILLVQTVKNIEGIKSGTYLTHIVTPIDNMVYTESTPDHPHPYYKKVITVAKPTVPIPKPKHLDFLRPNRGWLCDIDLIKPLKTAIDIPLQEKRNFLWNLFDTIDPDIYDWYQFNQNNIEETDEVKEGGERYLKHRFYERNPIIIKKVKALAERESRLFCEVCDFDFFKKYKTHGKGFIECHHKVPISSGERITKTEDLALVCSNCHRMLHRKNQSNSYYTIEELRSLLQ